MMRLLKRNYYKRLTSPTPRVQGFETADKNFRVMHTPTAESTSSSSIGMHVKTEHCTSCQESTPALVKVELSDL